MLQKFHSGNAVSGFGPRGGGGGGTGALLPPRRGRSSTRGLLPPVARHLRSAPAQPTVIPQKNSETRLWSNGLQWTNTKWIPCVTSDNVSLCHGNNFSVSINCFMGFTARLLLCALPLIYSPVSTPPTAVWTVKCDKKLQWASIVARTPRL